MKNKELEHGKQVRIVTTKHKGKSIVCDFCKAIFINQTYKPKKYCTHKCYGDAKIGEKHNWGDKISKSMKGKPKSQEHRLKVIEVLADLRSKGLIKMPTGENHHYWKGDGATYGSLHDWVARYRGTPKKCEQCLTEKDTVYQWANISGLYKRDLSDWKRLCVKCHRKMDMNIPRARKLYDYKGKQIHTRKATI